MFNFSRLFCKVFRYKFHHKLIVHNIVYVYKYTVFKSIQSPWRDSQYVPYSNCINVENMISRNYRNYTIVYI